MLQKFIERHMDVIQSSPLLMGILMFAQAQRGALSMNTALITVIVLLVVFQVAPTLIDSAATVHESVNLTYFTGAQGVIGLVIILLFVGLAYAAYQKFMGGRLGGAD